MFGIMNQYLKYYKLNGKIYRLHQVEGQSQEENLDLVVPNQDQDQNQIQKAEVHNVHIKDINQILTSPQ